MPPRTRKPQHTQQQSQQQQQQKDPLHNTDRPCCRLIQEAAQSIIEQKEPLGKIIFNHFRETRSKKQPSRKKKKKRKTDGVEPSVEPLLPESNECCKDTSSNKQSNLLLTRYILSRTPTDSQTTTKTTSAASSFHSLVTMLQETAGGCRIPMAQVQNALNEIQCSDCQSMVQDTFKNNLRLHLGTHASSLTVDNDDQDAFDYITMEEGRGKSPFDYQTANGSFQCMFENGQAVAWEWIPKCIHDWETVAEYSLLQGLPPDELLRDNCAASNSSLSLDEVKQLHDTVQSRATTLLQDFANMSKDLEAAIKKFAEVPQDDPSNMNFTSFPIIKDVDEVCCDIMARLLRVVLNVTRAVQCILDASGIALAGPLVREEIMQLQLSWATGPCENLWNIYMKAIQDMIQLIVVYEERLFKIADRHGKLQHLPFSSTARGFCHELVRSKVSVTHQAIDSYKKCLDSPVYTDPLACDGWTVHFMKKLFSEEEYYLKQMEKVKYKRKPPFDLAFEDMLYAIREWTETIHEGSVSKIIEGHQRRTEKLRRLVKNAEQHVQLKRKEVEKRNLPELDRTFAALGSLRKQLLGFLSVVAESEENSNAPLAARHHIGPSFAKIIIEWALLRSVVPYETNERWPQWEPLILSSDMQTTLYFPNRAGSDSYCRGGSGTRRATCILVGLFHRWMSDRCNEWHAEMAEKELLTAITEASDDRSDKGTKVGKKAKKKKKKNSATESEPAEFVEELLEDQEAVEVPIEPTLETGGDVFPQPPSSSKSETVEQVQQHQPKDQPQEAKIEDEWQPVTPSKSLSRKNKKKIPSSGPRLIDLEHEGKTVDVVGASLPPKFESKPPATKPTEESKSKPHKSQKNDSNEDFGSEYSQIAAIGASSISAICERGDSRKDTYNFSSAENIAISKQGRKAQMEEVKPIRAATAPELDSGFALHRTAESDSTNRTLATSKDQCNGSNSAIAMRSEVQGLDSAKAEGDDFDICSMKEVLVGVYSRSGEFESAEAFLIGRYIAIANAEQSKVVFWE